MAPEAPPRRLTRSRNDRMIGGVCGGLAQHTGLDPVIFRVVFVVAAILGGSGIAAYLIAWIAIPAEDEQESHVQSWFHDRDGIGRVLFIGLALVGLFVIGGMFDGPRHVGGGGLGLLVLLGVGLWLWTRHNDDQSPTAATADVVPPPPPAPPAPPSATAFTPPPRLKRERSRLFGLTVSVMLLAAGVLAAIEVSDIADVESGVVFATLLIVVGAGLVTGAWIGRSRGLIALGLVLTLFTAGATVADVPISGGMGERTWRPVRTAALEREYRLGAGNLDLDLRSLVLSSSRRVDISVGAGRVRIWLPEDADIELDTHVGMGSAFVLGLEENGVDVDRHDDLQVNGDHRLVMNVHVGMGRLEVMR